MKPSDTQLITDYLQGDARSLEILIRRYLKPVYGLAYHYTRHRQEAEDITQEVFIKVWRHLKRFKKNKSFKTWIFTIAKNTALDFLKKKKAILFSCFENEKGENNLGGILTDNTSSASKLLERADASRALLAAVKNLAAKYRLVLFLRYQQQLTFREIAVFLKEPLNTVKSRHRRGLAMLKNIFSTWNN